jgi:hypothetical protein
MCAGTNCKRAPHCYRWTATATPQYQSFFADINPETCCHYEPDWHAWWLFLDDVRTPDAKECAIDGKRCPRDRMRAVKSYKEAVRLIQLVCGTGGPLPYFIAFDHDLGSGKNGNDFAKWLTENASKYGGFRRGFSYRVHSMNHGGAANIIATMEAHLKTVGLGEPDIPYVPKPLF